MIKKVLIANRGEIAVRIIRACREMGIETVAVYSEADRDALHTQLADEAVCIGPAPSSQSYLSMENIISATIVTGADAIHPGFGFLSENSRFAELCEQCNITFIGPPANVIASLGNKQAAKNTMANAGVPIIPGGKNPIYTVEEGQKEAETIGYPVIIKAALGGGGKGMRVADTPVDFEESFRTAQKETQMAFGDSTMYVEHFVRHPRHIEFQIMADKFGNVIHLGERDCSIQRNHQKMIEESPCEVISEELRKKMGDAAVKAAKAAGYENAGTIEFLLDKEGRFYFMEMNTRIQVEHPVTEWVTGVDLVKEQIRIASGLPLSLSQEDIHLTGHAIECRINAENPAKGFRPSPGTITDMYFPGGKGINVSMVLKNLGFENTALGFLAGFTGNRIQDLLEEKGVRADFISVEKGISRINVKLRSNEETEINGQGPAIGEADIKKLYEKLDTLSDGDILVLAGSIPDVMPGSMYMDIMKHLQNKDLKIVVDATKDLLVNVLQYHPFLIKPNNHELGEMFGVTLKTRDEIVTYAKKLQEMGAENVLVSMAGDGAILLTEDGIIYKAKPPKGKVLNSVGAGDSMVAGFLTGYLNTGEYEKAFRLGVVTGSATAFQYWLATKEDIVALMEDKPETYGL